MSDLGWLEGVVLVNESRDVSSAGTVSVFRSAGEACRLPRTIEGLVAYVGFDD